MSPETSFGPQGRPAASAAFGATTHPSTRVTSSAATSAAALATISQADAKAWASFFTLAARNPAFAEEVSRLFDADPLLKRNHLTLYLHGRACLCQHHARQQRRLHHSACLKAISRFVVEHLLARPWAALKGMTTGQHDQQPLVLPAIVWNDRDAVEPPTPSDTLPDPSAVLVQPGADPASPKPQPAGLVH